MGPTTIFFGCLKNVDMCMKTRFLKVIFFSKARKHFFSSQMGMLYISKSKFEHQRIHSKKNRDHTTLRLEDMVETKKSGAKKNLPQVPL